MVIRASIAQHGGFEVSSQLFYAMIIFYFDYAAFWTVRLMRTACLHAMMTLVA